LNLQTEGKGDIIETVVNTGKRTDYDSGTVVRLEAVPSTGYYFSGWSLDVISEENPIEINIDRTKTVKATFKKLSYELSILNEGEGEGTVKEEIIDISDISESEANKFTDYEFGTIVRLTATAEEGSDFIEWEESGETIESNPLDIIVSEPKTVKAIFEYDLFNLGVGKWKIKKPKTLQEKAGYNVYSIIFNRNRSFRLNYSSGQISGTYSVTSNSNITLNNHGFLSNIQINKNQISFNLNITGLFQFNVVGSRVQTYQQNRTYIPDQNFEQALIDAGYDTTIDNYIDDSSMLAVTQLDISNRQIADFTGLEEFVNLTDLNLSGNTITSVPLVNLNKLTTLNLSNTDLKELDLSQNSNITSLDLSGNTGLSCVKVSQQIYQQVPSGWIYDSTTGFELECDCPTLSLTSGVPIQELCDGDAMQSLVYEYGGTGTTINVGTMPPGIVSNINSGTLTISGTPVFTNNDYSFSVFTSDGNAGCSQVSQTVTLSKKNGPSLTLDSGSYNQTITLGQSIDPIVVSFGGTATDLNITLNPVVSFQGLTRTLANPSIYNSQSGNTKTITGNYTLGPFTDYGTYAGSITTISSGGCNEITQNFQIDVTSAGGSSSGGNTTTGGTTASGNTTTGGNTTTSGNTSGGPGVVTTFGSTVPEGYQMAFSNGYLYVQSTGSTIKKVSVADASSSIIATSFVNNCSGNGYSGLECRLTSDAIAVDSNGNVYVHPLDVNPNPSQSVIKKITPQGNISILAGGNQGYAEGTGANANFQWSVCMIIGPDGNIYSTDSGRVRKITPSGVVTTYFEDTNNESLRAIVFDSSGNLFMSTYSTSRILKLTPSGDLSVFAGGQDGYLDATGTSAKFYKPSKMVIDSNNNLYVADNYARIRKITPSGVVTTLAGPNSQQSNGSAETGNFNGTGSDARFDWNSSVNVSLAIDSNNNLYVGERGKRIRKVTTN
jgi:hypothetical protein